MYVVSTALIFPDRVLFVAVSGLVMLLYSMHLSHSFLEGSTVLSVNSCVNF